MIEKVFPIWGERERRGGATALYKLSFMERKISVKMRTRQKF